MASTSPLLLRLVASSVCVSKRAGTVIQNVLRSGKLNIVEKTGADDLQTEADKSAQRCIISSLSRNFSKITIIGEEDLDESDVTPENYIECDMDSDVLGHEAELPESLKSVKDEDVVVWVDPLDGTSEFTKGYLDHVTVLIGIAVKGVAVAGVIYQPFYNYKNDPSWSSGRCIWGVIGLGTFGYTRDPSDPCKPDNANIIVTTRSHTNDTVNEAVQSCQPSQVVRIGGAGNKVLHVLEAKAHAYVFASAGCKKWDICAPEAILKAAGGNLTDIAGVGYEYHAEVEHENRTGVLATLHREKHDWYVNQIPDKVKNNLKSS